jgi:glycosyltransferase involved in cell wall biosynthesis
MKILFIGPSNSVHAIRWIEQAIDSGIDCALFDLVPGASTPTDSAISKHFTYENQQGFLSRLPIIGELTGMRRQYLLLKEAVNSFSPDVIHCHWLFHSLPFVATFLQDVRIISTPWGSDLQFPVKPLKGRLKKVIANRVLTSRIISKSDGFCCDSRQLASILKHRGATVDPRIIYFGTDISKFSSKNRSDEIRKKFGAGDGDLLIISNRSHENLYDIQTLIRAAFLLRNSHTNLRYVIAGSGSITESLKNLVKDLELQDIFYFTGRLNDAEFIGATASCDIYVSTSTSDGGLAASTAEAMSCEVPVVISEFGENAEWLTNETAGLLFEIGNENELANKIQRLAQSEDLRRAMGRAGRDKISTDNNSVLEWQKVLKMYDDINPLS